MSQHIPIQEACERIGVTSSSLCVSEKYKKYYKKSSIGSRDASFDLDGYMKEQDAKTELVEKTKLLVEYMNKIEDVGYLEMAKLAKVDHQNLYSLIFGFGIALKIVRSIAIHRAHHFARFDEWYNWSHKPRKIKKLF